MMLQTLFQSVVMLRRSVSTNDPEGRLLYDMIQRIWRGECGQLAAKELTEEYGVLCTASDEDQELDLRRHVIVEGVLRCMQAGSEASRRWTLHHVEVSIIHRI